MKETSEGTNAEFGALTEAEKNRYWQIKLSKFNVLSFDHNWFGRLFWRFLTFIMFWPLLITAKYYSHKFKRKNLEAARPETLPYQLFTDVYPGCVYSPFVKAYELELFKKGDIREPVLEIGIGDGYVSSLLFTDKKMKATFGSDLMYGVLRSARRYEHCQNYLIMDAVEIPLPDGSLETVIMNNLMHHLPNRVQVLTEILRVLKKDGRLIFTDNTLGWGVYTWEQLLLRKLWMKGLADRILEYKLKLLAQNLLVDAHFYENKAVELDFTITKKVDFVSRQTMYLSSLFEFLNLKQGQPTRQEMRSWFAFFGCRKALGRYLADIVEYCYRTDHARGEADGFAFQFVEIRKNGGVSADRGNAASIPYVCPRCKGALEKNGSSFLCRPCGAGYPVFDGIPVFLSYQGKLEGFESYLQMKKEGSVENFMT